MSSWLVYTLCSRRRPHEKLKLMVFTPAGKLKSTLLFNHSNSRSVHAANLRWHRKRPNTFCREVKVFTAGSRERVLVRISAARSISCLFRLVSCGAWTQHECCPASWENASKLSYFPFSLNWRGTVLKESRSLSCCQNSLSSSSPASSSWLRVNTSDSLPNVSFHFLAAWETEETGTGFWQDGWEHEKKNNREVGRC